MAELFAILITGFAGIAVPSFLMLLLKVKPSSGAADDGYIDGFIVGILTSHSE
jgi:hypothetical protein